MRIHTFLGCAYLGLLLLCAGVHGYDQRCPQGLPFNVRPFNGLCYQFVEEEKFWDDARDYCTWHGGKLVKVGNLETSNFIIATLSALRWTKNGVWIGLHDRRKEMTWHWVTETAGRHEPLTWSNWARGHPGGFWHSARDCVRMVRKDNWRWHDTACHFLKYHYRFICEYDMLPTTTTTTTEATTTPSAPVVLRHFAVEKTQLPVAHGANRVEMETTVEKIDVTTTDTNEIAVFLGAAQDPRARKQLAADDRQNPAILAAIIVCGVLGLVMLVLIVLLFLRRRRRSKKLEGSAVYEHVGQEQHHGGCEADCEQRTRRVDGCTVEISGLKSKRVENDYVVQEFDKTTENTTTDQEKVGDTTITTDGLQTAATLSGETDSESESDASRLMKRPLPEEPYEVPVSNSSYYLSMNGAGGKTRTSPLPTRQTSSEAGYVGHEPAGANKEETKPVRAAYDAPKPTNLYAEIPDQEYGNIYETLDDVKDKVEHHYVN